MKRLLVPCLLLCVGLSLASAAYAQHRGSFAVAPQIHQLPMQQYHQPPLHQPTVQIPNHLYNHVGPGIPEHHDNLGRHGLPLVQGIHGWHETHNRSEFAIVPSLDSDEAPIDIEDYIDSIDLTAPLEPVEGCTTVPCLWAALSITDDGTWGAAWNYTSSILASNAATNTCLSYQHGQCFSAVVAGKAYLAALHCQHDSGYMASFWAAGNDPNAALDNLYRSVAQKGEYNVLNECWFVTWVTPDGSQGQFAEQE